MHYDDITIASRYTTMNMLKAKSEPTFNALKRCTACFLKIPANPINPAAKGANEKRNTTPKSTIMEIINQL
jgi:hypothetical protein